MSIVKITPDMVARAIAETDWEAIDAQTDEDIARNVASDPDAPPILTDGETAAAIMNMTMRQPGEREFKTEMPETDK